MTQAAHLTFLRSLTWDHVALVAAVLAGAGVLILLVRGLVRRAAERAPSHRRLLILRAAPLARLLIGFSGLAIIVPILVEPNVEDLLATAGVALAFALKDYVSCLIAGVVTIIENTYQPGDWIEFDGAYGEVRTIGTRAVHIITADETEVIIPHAKIWSTRVSNSSSGQSSLAIVTHFYLNADHDGAAVRRALAEIAETSSYRKPDTPVTVGANDTPFGTHYILRVHVAESREQFAMVTDLTLRAKTQLRAMGVAFAQTPYARGGA